MYNIDKFDLIYDIHSFEKIEIQFKIPDDIIILKLYSQFFQNPLPPYEKVSIVSRFYKYSNACLIPNFNKKPSTKFRYTAYYIDLIYRTSIWLEEDNTIKSLVEKVECSNFIIYCSKLKEVRRFKRITH